MKNNKDKQFDRNKIKLDVINFQYLDTVAI